MYRGIYCRVCIEESTVGVCIEESTVCIEESTVEYV